MMLLLLLSLLAHGPSFATEEEKSLSDQCFETLKSLPGKTKEAELKKACAEVTVLEGCVSVNGTKIFHYDHPAKSKPEEAKRILVFSLIHGDEYDSGSVGRSWIERLTTIEPRNSWRVVPVLNPDGVKKGTRFNANGVDVNRNFPTKNWENEAIQYWEKKLDKKKDPRRFPGNTAASEPETKCAMKHIDDYKPDLILSIHTPYGVLDFDGPKIPPPKFPHIPWKSLGNYPGSLGRYMWVDRSKPTLTIELQAEGVADQLDKFDKLQDISGDIVIKAEKLLKEKEKKEAAAKENKKASKKQ